MARCIPALFVLVLLTAAQAAAQQAQAPQGAQYPPVFFREDWRLADGLPNINKPEEPEHAFVQAAVATAKLEVRLYGGKAGRAPGKPPSTPPTPTGIARLVLSSRERVVTIGARENGMFVCTLRNPNEVRGTAEYFGNIPAGTPEPEMLQLAEALLTPKATTFDAKH